MIILTLLVATALLVTGVVSYLITDANSVTALIPTFVGIVLLVLAFVARNDKARKHALHVVMVVALLGAIGSLRNMMGLGELFAGTASAPVAVISSTIMFVLLLALLIAGIRTFIAARRARSDAPAAE